MDLRSEDITFEICAELPENLAQEFYAGSAQEVVCNNWIAFINDESHYPKKPMRKTSANNFSFEISPDCDYLDICFVIFLYGKANDELKERIENAFREFLEYYNMKHQDKIHDIFNVKDMAEYPSIIDDENVMQLHVDFGNSSLKAIEKSVDWLQDYDLDIEKIVLM